MTWCAFRYCKNTSRNVSEASGVSFHRFVNSDHPKSEEWLRIIQTDRSEDTWFPTKFSYICSAHFKPEDIYITKTGRRFLKKSAVPCINPEKPLDKVPISACESVFDTPHSIRLKKQLSKVSALNKELCKKNIILQRQNKYLRKRTEFLTAFVKQLKEKVEMKKINEMKKKNEIKEIIEIKEEVPIADVSELCEVIM